jgi:uncharacterized SAM-binding protein YcdF (DUF218 family)
MLKSKLLQILTLKKYKKRILGVFAGFVFLIFFFQEEKKVLNYPQVELIDTLALHDCGVVLTGSAGRIREAFEVLSQKKIKRLIISGVYKDTKLNEIFPQLPFYSDIDADSIVLEKISGSTYGNAVQTQLVSEAMRCDDLLLMTSDIHMQRAYRMFKVIFPEDFKISKYHIVNSAKENTLFDVYLETFKSLFYNFIYVVVPYI